MRRRSATLAAIGTVAGFLSGLFGVGGGIVIVPRLVVALGFDVKVAAGTSLAAVGVTAAIGSAAQGAYGNVDVARAIALGIPAIAGVFTGIALQDRIGNATVSTLFAALLFLVAVDLAMEALT